MSKEFKCIRAVVVKNKTINGDLCKTKIRISNEGIIGIDRYTLSSDDLKFSTKLCTKFGKSLYHTQMAFRFSTFIAIHKQAIKAIMENKIKLEDVL